MFFYKITKLTSWWSSQRKFSHYHHHYESTLFTYLITLLALRSSIIHIISLYLRLSTFVFCLSIIETFAYTQHNITFLLLSCCIKSLLLYINNLTLIREGGRSLCWGIRSFALEIHCDLNVMVGNMDTTLEYYTLFTFIRFYVALSCSYVYMYLPTYTM